MEKEKNYTFAEWANVWLEDYKRGTVKANTFRQTYQDIFRLYLIPTFGSLKLDELTREKVEDYIVSLSEKFSQSLLSKIRLCVMGMYDVAIDKKIVNMANPARKIKVRSLKEKKTKQTFSKEEADRVFDYASAHKYGVGICLLLDLGLRCSEMLGLKWGDVDFRANCISIKRASVTIDYKAVVSTPKTPTSIRTLPMSQRLARLLKKNCGEKDEYIIHHNNKAPYNPIDYTRYRYNVFFKDASADLGIPRLSPHELRHTCGTNLYARSGDIYAVSKYLGHASVETTAHYYVHSSPEVLRSRLMIN